MCFVIIFNLRGELCGNDNNSGSYGGKTEDVKWQLETRKFCHRRGNDGQAFLNEYEIR